MPTVTPPSITALPAPPDPNNRATFNTLAYPWSVAQQTLATQVGAVATNVKANADDAASSTSAAATQANLATTNGAAQVTLAATQAGLATTNGAAQVTLAANQVGLAANQVTLATNQATAASSSAVAAGATAWVSGTTYAVGAARFSLINFQTYRRAIAGAGTVDPALDTVNWFNANVGDVSNLPNLRPTLNLNFANSQRVDSRITFTRASTATRINNRGLIESVLSGTPRINFDPVTLACRGLLIEEQRTNLLTYSEQFDNAAWTKNAPLVVGTANSTVAPDGSMTADTLTATNGGSFSQDVTASGTGTYTVSIFIHTSSTCTNFILSGFFLGSSTESFGNLVINLQTGAFISATASTYAITNVGGGWYRYSVSKTGTIAGNTTVRFQTYNQIVTPSTIVVWGAQLEAGAFATSYNPTVAAQVTRAADVAIMSGANFSSWYNQTEGTFAVGFDHLAPSSPGFDRVFEVNDGTLGNTNITLLKNNGAGSVFTSVSVAGVNQVALQAPTMTANVAVKTALAYKLNDFAQSHNGATVITDSSGTVPTMTHLGFCSAGGVSPHNGHIQSLAFFSKRLTNLELQALTTQ